MSIIANSWHQRFDQAEWSLGRLGLSLNRCFLEFLGHHSLSLHLWSGLIWVEVSAVLLLLEDDHDLANLSTAQRFSI